MRIICIAQAASTPGPSPEAIREAEKLVGLRDQIARVMRKANSKDRRRFRRIMESMGVDMHGKTVNQMMDELTQKVRAAAASTPPAAAPAAATTPPAAATGTPAAAGAPAAAAGAPGTTGEAAGAASTASVSDAPSQDKIIEIVKEIADKEENPYADALIKAYDPSSPLASMSNSNMRKISEEMGDKVMKDRTILAQITDPENPTLVKAQKEIALFGICLALAELVGDKSISMLIEPAARVLQGIKKLKDNPVNHDRGGPGAFARAVGSMVRDTPDADTAQKEMLKLQDVVLIRYKLNHPAVLGKVLAKGYEQAKNDIRQDPIASELKKNPAEYSESDVEAGMGDFQNKYAKMMRPTPQKALTDENLTKLGRAVFLAAFLAKNKKLAGNSAVTGLFNNAIAQADAIFSGWLTITPKNYVSAISGFVGNKGANPKASAREAQLRSVFDAQANALTVPKGVQIVLDGDKLTLLKSDMLSIGKIYARAKTYNRLEKDWPSIQEAQEAASWMAQVLIAAFGNLNTPKGKSYLEENISRLAKVWPDWSQTITGKVFKNKGSPATILLGLYGKRMSANRMSQEDYHEIGDIVKQTALQKITQAISRIKISDQPDKRFEKLDKVIQQNDNHLLEPRIINDVLADNKDTPLVTGGDIGMADMIISSYAVSKPNEVQTEARWQNIAWKILEEIRGWGEHHHKKEGADTPYEWQQAKRDANPTPEEKPEYLVNTSDEREHHETNEIVEDVKNVDAWGYKETIAFASVVLWVLAAKASGVR